MTDVVFSFPAECSQVPTGLAAPHDPPVPARTVTTTTAHLLALAHLVERQIEDGAVRDYREAAQRLGISRARLFNICSLATLSPALQSALLCGKRVGSISWLFRLAACTTWERHDQALPQSCRRSAE